MNKENLCPNCRTTAINETGNIFNCWFCDKQFSASEIIQEEREISHNRIRGEFRLHIGKFLKRLEVRAQISILSRVFWLYEDYCGERNLKAETKQALNSFVNNVTDWKLIFDEAQSR